MNPDARQALENALAANPDDLGAHAAYADFLLEQGDPRGEFIQVQLALEDEKKPPEERKRLQAREQELLAQHGQQWLGSLAQGTEVQPGFLGRLFGARPRTSGLPPFEHRFVRGWLDSFKTDQFDERLARALAAEPGPRLLRRLELYGFRDYEPPVGILSQSDFLGNVRFFHFGGEDQCYVTGAGIVEVVQKMPRLEELTILAHRTDTAALFALDTLAQLRLLRVDHAHAYALEVLAANPALGRLERLSCWPHALEIGDEQPYLTRASVEALIQSPHLKSLVHLELHLSDLGDEGCRAIVTSGILGRLQTLDLSNGLIGDEGARALARSPDLPKLRELKLNENCLTAAGLDALRATGVNFVAEHQWQPSGNADDDLQYLFAGDME